jgi:2'-5' RNA ligase
MVLLYGMIKRMKRRLFVAIPVPEAISRELRYAIDRIDDSILSCGREIPEIDWHITLKFIGEEDEKNIPKIMEAMKHVVELHKEKGKEIYITEVTFDTHKPPRIIWANGSPDDSKMLGVMRNEFDKKCNALGIMKKNDWKDFTAHISLIRLFKNPPRESYVREPIEMAYKIPSLDLMESVLQKGGPEYKCIERISFS